MLMKAKEKYISLVVEVTVSVSKNH